MCVHKALVVRSLRVCAAWRCRRNRMSVRSPEASNLEVRGTVENWVDTLRTTICMQNIYIYIYIYIYTYIYIYIYIYTHTHTHRVLLRVLLRVKGLVFGLTCSSVYHSLCVEAWHSCRVLRTDHTTHHMEKPGSVNARVQGLGFEGSRRRVQASRIEPFPLSPEP